MIVCRMRWFSRAWCWWEDREIALLLLPNRLFRNRDRDRDRGLEFRYIFSTHGVYVLNNFFVKENQVLVQKKPGPIKKNRSWLKSIVFVRRNTETWTNAYKCAYIHTWMNMHTCIYAHVYIYIYIYIYIYTWMNEYIYMHVCTRVNMCMYIYIYIYIYITSFQ